MFKNDSNYIISEVKSIRQKVMQRLPKSHIIETHKSFHDSYFKLFESALEYDFDMDMLTFFLEHRDTIDDNNINDVDNKIMEHLQQKYIKPVVKT